MRYIAFTSVKFHSRSKHELSKAPRRGPARRLQQLLKATKGQPANARPLTRERWLFEFEEGFVIYIVKDEPIVSWLPFLIVRNVIIVRMFTVRRVD